LAGRVGDESATRIGAGLGLERLRGMERPPASVSVRYHPGMCGRFTREFSWAQVRDFLDLRWPEAAEIAPSWNVAPTQFSPVARAAAEGEHEGERELAPMKWGLVPFWAKDAGIGSKMINARAEGIEAKPAFRAAFKSRRCVVPVSGFYEWKKPAGGAEGEPGRSGSRGKPAKRPYYIFPAEGKILALAGLWERWDKGDGPLETFTIITTTPNAMMAELHDRMPVVLYGGGVRAWLDPGLGQDQALALLVPAPEGTLDCREVGTGVNGPRNDGPELVRAVGGLF
jgi:putative SOS response-associated peptidase YedK